MRTLNRCDVTIYARFYAHFTEKSIVWQDANNYSNYRNSCPHTARITNHKPQYCYLHTVNYYYYYYYYYFF